jgi:hypothetical protein
MRKSKLGTKLSDSHKKKISKAVKAKYKEVPNYNRSGGNIKKLLNKEIFFYLILFIYNPSITQII